MDIKQFKQFKAEYTFMGIIEEYSLLKTIKNNTSELSITQKCSHIQAGSANAKRSQGVKDDLIFLHYVYYLCQFTSGHLLNYDKLYNWLNKDRDTYVNEVTIREVLR